MAEPKVSVHKCSGINCSCSTTSKSSGDRAKNHYWRSIKAVPVCALTTQGEQGASSLLLANLRSRAQPEMILTVTEKKRQSYSGRQRPTHLAISSNPAWKNQSGYFSIRPWNGFQLVKNKLISWAELNLIQPEVLNQLKEKMLMMVKDKVHTAQIC